MKKTNLNSECKDLEFIIENLLTGKESCETEDSQYTPEDAIDFLQGFLQELNELNTQIIEQGNTPELLDCVFKKYTELWLFHLDFTIDHLPRVIMGLWRYPECD